ncbi:MAG TPA: YbaK/EbsC family protein, partial [Bryobacteraceae bacterium]
MLWSKLFIPTLREAPAGVDHPGTRLLIRAGYQRANGTIQLTLAQRSLSKLTARIRHELDSLGGQEMWSIPPLATAAAGSIRSYKQLPQLWYQTKDAIVEIVTFDRAAEQLEITRRCIEQIVQNLLASIPNESAEAQSGSRDGIARQFVAFSPMGRTKVAWCEEARYAATLDFAHAIAKPPAAPDPGDGAPLTPERFHTPNRKTIADLVEFTGLPATSQIKSLVQVDSNGKPYLVLVRGDHQLSRPK